MSRVVMPLLIAMGTLTVGCSDAPRTLHVPEFDATEPFPELANTTPVQAEAVELEYALPDDGTPDLNEGLVQRVPILNQFTLDLPKEYERWKWSSSDTAVLITHNQPESAPDIVIYFEKFGTLPLSQYVFSETRTHLINTDAWVPTVDPMLGSHFLWTFTAEDTAAAIKERFFLWSPTFGQGLGYISNPSAFTGYRWVGRHPETRIMFRVGRTTGNWITGNEHIKRTVNGATEATVSLASRVASKATSLMPSSDDEPGAASDTPEPAPMTDEQQVADAMDSLSVALDNPTDPDAVGAVSGPLQSLFDQLSEALPEDGAPLENRERAAYQLVGSIQSEGGSGAYFAVICELAPQCKQAEAISAMLASIQVSSGVATTASDESSSMMMHATGQGMFVLSESWLSEDLFNDFSSDDVEALIEEAEANGLEVPKDARSILEQLQSGDLSGLSTENIEAATKAIEDATNQP